MTVEHVEESLDPTKELARLVAEGKLEEAFNKALSRTDVGIVSWLCNQVTTFYRLYLHFFVLNLHVMISQLFYHSEHPCKLFQPCVSLSLLSHVS